MQKKQASSHSTKGNRTCTFLIALWFITVVCVSWNQLYLFKMLKISTTKLQVPSRVSNLFSNNRITKWIRATEGNQNTTSEKILDSKQPRAEENHDFFVPQKIHVFTFADRLKTDRPITYKKKTINSICLLGASLQKYGIQLNVLGWNQSIHFADGTSCTSDGCEVAEEDSPQSHARKIFWQHNLSQKYQEYGIHDDDLILFMDAYDVLMLSDPTRLTELYLRHTRNKRGIVFNGEPTCGNSFLLWGSYGKLLRGQKYQVQLRVDEEPRIFTGHEMCTVMMSKTLMNSVSNGPFFGLNSGLFIGDAKSLQQFFAKIMEVRATINFEYHGDQFLYQLAYLRYPEINILIDTDASLFYTFSYLFRPGDVTGILFDKCSKNFLQGKKNKVIVRYTHETEPVFMHFPGRWDTLYTKCVQNPYKKMYPSMANAIIRDFDRQENILGKVIC